MTTGLPAYNTLVVGAGVAVVGFAAGVVGSLALLRKRPLVADAAAHCTLAGAALAVLFGGNRDLATLLRRKVPYLRRAIGCVFQDFRLLPDRTAAENVAYALQVTGHSQKEVRRRVPEILSLVGLDGKFDRLPRELSGGEQQRVSIARALVNHPRLLIADEPTGNLDPETSLGIMDLLLRINRTGTTVLVATHDQHTVDRMQMRVIALDEGRVVRDEESAGYHDETGEVLA